MSLLKDIWRLVLPGPEPTLDLDFTAEALDPRITFTRASTKTYFGADGLLKSALANEWPRDFDPITGECLGRSVWEQRTNLLVRSTEFDNTSWSKANATITANQETAPDGTLTADLLTASAASGKVEQNITVAAGSTFTTFVKKGTSSFAEVDTGSAGFHDFVVFNLDTLAIDRRNNNSAAAITPLVGGWFRLSVTRGATTGTRVSVSPLTASGSLYIWGAQLEAGAFASPYIPTTTAAVTRSADSVLLTDLAAIGYNPQASTVLSEFTYAPGIAPTTYGRSGGLQFRFFRTSGSIFTNQIVAGAGAFTNPPRVYASFRDVAVSGFDDENPTSGVGNPRMVNVGVPSKVAVAWEVARDFAISTNFPEFLKKNQPLLPPTTWDRLSLSHAYDNSVFCGMKRRFRYWPLRLSDAELRGLSG